jgi:hypothetical protein
VVDESLVGDRQFWVTRPYSWRSLLGAKALFLAVFVLAPVLASDALILAADGFSPRALLPRLLLFELLKLAILIDAAVLASITNGMRQFLLGCLLLVVVAEAEQLAGSMRAWVAIWERVLYFGLPIALLVWQYARRRTQVVRSLAAGAVVFSAIALHWPNPDIPVTGTGLRPDIGIRFDASRQPLNIEPQPWMHDRVEVTLPVELTGRERDLLNGALADLEVQHGDSMWRPRRDRRTNLARRDDRNWLEIAFREGDYRRLQNDSVTLRAEFAIWVYERRNGVALHRNTGWQRIEGVGFARIQSGMGGVWVVRRSAFHEPEQKLLYSMPLLWFGGVIRRIERHLSSESPRMASDPGGHVGDPACLA